jgi:putative membrane protein
MFYMHDIGWGWWLLMSIGMVAFWAIVIYGIAWLLRGSQNMQQHHESHTPSPQETLKQRLARGEISIDEYRRLLEALEEQPPQQSMAA